MASVSSGSFNTSNTGGIGANYPKRATYSWWINSQSVANNTTSIGYKLVLGGGDSSYSSIATYNCGTTTDGESKTFSGGGTYYGNGKELISGTKTISHNADGTKTFSASAYINLYWSSGHSVSGSGTWTLPTIARQAYLSTVQNFNDNGNPTITYTNAAGSAVGTLQACIASSDGNTIYAAYRNINKTGTLSYTFNLTTAERNTLLAACANSNSLAVRFYLKTVIGSTTFYDYKAATMNVVSANPTFSNYTYSDTNSTITAITGNNQVLVANKSTLSVVISSANKAVANKQATMSNYVASLSGKTASASYSSSGNTLTFSSNAFSAGTQTLAVKATDSRGNYTIVNKNVTVVDYSNPAINAVAQRVNNFENNTSITFSGSISPITVGGTRKNDLVGNVQYRYKNQNTSTWGSWTNLTASVASNGTLTITGITLSLANTSSWDMQVKVQDKLATTTKSIVISQGQPQFFVGDDGRVAVGGTPSYNKDSGETGLLDVKGKVYASASMYVEGGNRVYSSVFSPRHTILASNYVPSGGDTTSGWSALASGGYLCYYSQTGKLTNQPSQWGYLEVFVNGTEVSQIWHQQNSGQMYWRAGNASGWNGGGQWKYIPAIDNRAQAGEWSSFYFAGTNHADGESTVYTRKGTELTIRHGAGGSECYIKAGGSGIRVMRQTWASKFSSNINANYGVAGVGNATKVYTRYLGAYVNGSGLVAGEWQSTANSGGVNSYADLASTTGGNRSASQGTATIYRTGNSNGWVLSGWVGSDNVGTSMNFECHVTAGDAAHVPSIYQRSATTSNTSSYYNLLEVFEN